MKFSIVTPSFNRPDYLDTTIRSVIEQEGGFEIEYIIQDGGSSEETISLLKLWEERVSQQLIPVRCKKITLKWFTELDDGMYHAIQKGFLHATGDIMAWINSDDFYLPGAFSTVAEIFSMYPAIRWLSGIPVCSNRVNVITGVRYNLRPYVREYIRRGYYQGKYKYYGMNWIQQDSVFWRTDLWAQSGGLNDLDLKYAGDFYLWRRFANYSDLVSIHAVLSCYRFHGDQITATPVLYNGEIEAATHGPPCGLLIFNVLYQCISSSSKAIYAINTRYCFLVKLFLMMLGLDWKILRGYILEWSSVEDKWIIKDSF